jgi:hypothetical protein
LAAEVFVDGYEAAGARRCGALNFGDVLIDEATETGKYLRNMVVIFNETLRMTYSAP